jgi:hypothetical protein
VRAAAGGRSQAEEAASCEPDVVKVEMVLASSSEPSDVVEVAQSSRAEGPTTLMRVGHDPYSGPARASLGQIGTNRRRHQFLFWMTPSSKGIGTGCKWGFSPSTRPCPWRCLPYMMISAWLTRYVELVDAYFLVLPPFPMILMWPSAQALFDKSRAKLEFLHREQGTWGH